eukprot:6555620-Alexandrium_andersonii.AAC.1
MHPCTHAGARACGHAGTHVCARVRERVFAGGPDVRDGLLASSGRGRQAGTRLCEWFLRPGWSVRVGPWCG